MTLVIYDYMADYASELAMYFSRKNHAIRASVFFEKAELAAYLKKETPDVLLVAEKLLDDDIRQMKCGRLVLLLDTHEDVPAADGTEAAIGRYQAADEILSSVLLICGTSTRADRINKHISAKDAAMTAFYAPAPCPLQSELVRQYARDRGRKERVLYLNLRENAGFEERYARTYKRDFSDLLFMSMHRSGDFSLLLGSVICEDDGLEYVPPMEDAVNAFLVAGKDWNIFLERLKLESGFERIVFDLGALFPGAYEIFACCEEICLLTQGTAAQKNSMRHFLRVYEKRYGSGEVRKLKEVRLPEHQEG